MFRRAGSYGCLGIGLIAVGVYLPFAIGVEWLKTALLSFGFGSYLVGRSALEVYVARLPLEKYVTGVGVVAPEERERLLRKPRMIDRHWLLLEDAASEAGEPFLGAVQVSPAVAQRLSGGAAFAAFGRTEVGSFVTLANESETIWASRLSRVPREWEFL